MKSYREQTYYELLEVDPSATMDDIRNAYSRQVRLYDSDSVALYPVGDPAEVEALKKLLLEAMEILTDDDLRVEYDKQLGLPNVIRAAPADHKPEVPEVPPDAEEIDHRADESREEADQTHTHEMEDEVAPALHPTVTEEPPPDEPEEEERVPAAAEPAPTAPPPSADEIDERADESREEADKEEEKHVHDGVQLAPPTQLAPTQLAMDDLLARAEAVHSTGPRYSFSWVQQGTTDIVEVDDASIIPLSDAPTEVAAPARADEQSTSRTTAEVEPSGPVPLAPLLPPPSPPPPVNAAPPRPPPPEPPPLPPKPAPVRDLSRAQHIAQEEAIATAESALAEVSHLVRVTRGEQKAPPPPTHAAPAPAHAPPPRPRVEIGPDTEIGGELLRQVRESKGLTLHQLADRTRITARHLENVEADRYDALPPTVYLRGILMSIARELGLDALRASKSYLSLVEKALGKR